jgi:hypothetical protein
MKSKILQRTGTVSSAFVLALFLACKPANNTTAQQPAPPAAPAAAEAAKPAAGTVRYDAQPTGSKMIIEGTSTIHDWHMDSVVLGGWIECDPKFPDSALTDPKAAKPNVYVFMPVRSFKSYNKRMDEVMQEHMKEPQFKKIEYRLTELKPKSAAGATGPLQFDAIGALTIAGKTNTHTMTVAIAKAEGNKLKITGSTALKMTAFGVEPPAPSIGLGLIKTGDDIKLTFEWLLQQKAQ